VRALRLDTSKQQLLLKQQAGTSIRFNTVSPLDAHGLAPSIKVHAAKPTGASCLARLSPNAGLEQSPNNESTASQIDAPRGCQG